MATSTFRFPLSASETQRQLPQFYIGADGKMMAVEVKGGSKFEAGVPKPLFETRLGANAGFDVSKDGRFLLPTRIEQTGPVSMNVVVNWTAGLKR